MGELSKNVPHRFRIQKGSASDKVETKITVSPSTLKGAGNE